MLKNYFLISFRSLKKEKSFTVINLLGLAVGITCFIALTLFVLDEIGYDTFHKNTDNIYRAYVHSNINGEESYNSKTPAPLGATLKQYFPEVEDYTRIGYSGIHLLKYGDKVFREGDVYLADSNFFEVFGFQLISGNKQTVLDRPNSIVITETTAEKYFGNENPVGKSFTADDKDSYLITGVMKDFPKKSHFSCRYLLSMSTYTFPENQYWLDLWYTTYVVLKKGTDADKFEKSLKTIVANYLAPQAEKALGFSIEEFFQKGNLYEYRLQPLTSIYLYSRRDHNIDLNSEWSNIKSSDITYVYIISIVAVFILLLAIVNFINLSTAKSGKRAKEVGIRKTLGSDRLRLIGQFISESTLLVFLAVLLSLVLLELLLPYFSAFLKKDISLDYFGNIFTLPLLLLFILIVGVLAGSYPAFYLSSFQPAAVMKSGHSRRNRKQNFRSILVIGQFAVSIVLITGTIIIKNQLEYIQNKNLGFDKNYLVSINGIDAVKKRLQPFKNELAKNPNIISMTNSSRMFQSGVPGTGYLFNQRAGMDIVSANYLDVDYNFLKAFQIEIKEGRFFSEEYPTDSSAVVINESAVREFNAENPIGKIITRIENKSDYDTYTIIGVVKDFNYQSLHETVHPLFLHLSEVRQPADILTMRIASKDIINTLEYIRKKWNNFSDDEYFNYSFVNDKLTNLYENERRMGIITTVFSVIAVFIACLGLFGLVAFVAEQKTKEIGIRKILGASVIEIVLLLSKQFTKWVIIASVLAWPVAYYSMRSWLQDFAYRIDINWWMFVLSGCIALAIALATLIFHAMKAAMADPVNSLRYE
ncbi:MAG: ABC transporter permease [Melioribacteraceae bacterium]|nr:ABC transporter permease [Melioribacteraceae bacterium]